MHFLLFSYLFPFRPTPERKLMHVNDLSLLKGLVCCVMHVDLIKSVMKALFLLMMVDPIISNFIIHSLISTKGDIYNIK